MKLIGDPPAIPAPAASLRGAANNRLALLCLVVPLLLLAGTGFSGLVRHLWAERRPAVGVGTEAAAARAARDLCVQLTGGPVEVMDATLQSGYSVHRHEAYHEWNVVCNTVWGVYNLRVNARTNRVYALNPQSDAVSGAHAAPRPNTVHAAGLNLPFSAAKVMGRDVPRRLRGSRTVAEGTLGGYLATLGESPERLSRGMVYASPSLDVSDPEDVVWTFAFRASDSDPSQLIRIAVSTSNRRLINYWNPSEAQ